MNKCPGQDSRKLTVSELICPNCHTKVEIFSDEVQTKCPTCKEIVCKDRLPDCVFWCKAAASCIGMDKYQKIMNQNKDK